MKTLTSSLLGAAALTAALFATIQPAQARSDVGVYVGPGGIGVNVDRYRDYCRDRIYRHEHWGYCHRYYDRDDYDDGYYAPLYFWFDSYGHRHHRDRDWGHERHDRDDHHRSW